MLEILSIYIYTDIVSVWHTLTPPPADQPWQVGYRMIAHCYYIPMNTLLLMVFIGVSRHSKGNVCRISIVSARPAKKENLTQRLLLHAPSVVAFARPALGCAHTVGFTDVFIARDGPPQQLYSYRIYSYEP